MIDFNDVPKVELDFMNHDHEEATNLVNQLQSLIEAAESGEDKTEEITQALKALYKHNEEHFAREEEQMQKFNFPPFPVHQGEHQRVLEVMQEEIEAWQAGQNIARLKSYIVDTLPRWFISHIESMDTVTAMFIARSSS